MNDRKIIEVSHIYGEGDFPFNLYDFVRWAENLPNVHEGIDHIICVDGNGGVGGWIEVIWKRFEKDNEVLCRKALEDLDRDYLARINKTDWTHRNAERLEIDKEHYRDRLRIKEIYER